MSDEQARPDGNGLPAVDGTPADTDVIAAAMAPVNDAAGGPAADRDDTDKKQLAEEKIAAQLGDFA